MPKLLPLFLNLTGRAVLLVGGGPVAAAKLRQLLAVEADVRVVAPAVCQEIRDARVVIAERPFNAADLDGICLVIAAATPAVNRIVAEAATARGVFVNAVDDPDNATAFMGGVVCRGDFTIAVSTGGRAPALASLAREALDEILSDDVSTWTAEAERLRRSWRIRNVPLNERKPLLLEALNRRYERTAE